jgi:type II secretory pathway pseudopilin PulG
MAMLRIPRVNCSILERYPRVGRNATGGFSMTELVVIIGIITVLMSMLLPALVKARGTARKTQCMSNLRQLGQALMMYDSDHDRLLENYPDRLTDLYKLDYAPDQRVFVCPMDTTGAKGNTLKPGKAHDNKYDWAERISFGNAANSSYLYEFSTRLCATYTDDTWDDDMSWPASVLVEWDDSGPWWVPTPSLMDRDGDGSGNGKITWQEAKFWQLENADAYVTGTASPGDTGIPATWSEDPWDQINMNGAVQPRNYPRTWLPIVRCFWHQNAALVDEEKYEDVVNLAIDGNVFNSSPGWEQTAWKYGLKQGTLDDSGDTSDSDPGP